jgi:hypothetical protein
MTTFSKAYTLKRNEEQRKKADLLRRARNFATLASYYRYRDEMDFRALVTAKHPLVVEAYPELFAHESPRDESSEPETLVEENLETQSEEPKSPHSSPLHTPKRSNEEPQNIIREEVAR